MGLIGFLALAANVASMLIQGDANVKSVWLCWHNDAIGNTVVMLAALGVSSMTSASPDVVAEAILASLFLNSASKILRPALDEWRSTHAAR